jgi:release factor glutamine methyltransferase
MEAERNSVRSQIVALLAQAGGALAEAGIDNPNLDASLMLAAALGVERARLHTGSVSLDEASLSRFRQFVARRAVREPLAYIIGHKEFFGLDFAVSRDVLIPRPETELLVETALAVLRAKRFATVLDIGTGCGAIAVAIAVNASNARIAATDIAPAALEIARRSAARHRCERRIEFALGDCWAAPICSHRKFDLILSNPPYIAEGELARLEPEVARFEPEMALMGGKDGLDFYRRIAREAASHLNADGEVIVEVGAGQAPAVAALLQAGGFQRLELLRDLAGHQRVVRARLAD